jgi:hypothetical protein
MRLELLPCDLLMDLTLGDNDGSENLVLGGNCGNRERVSFTKVVPRAVNGDVGPPLAGYVCWRLQLE